MNDTWQKVMDCKKADTRHIRNDVANNLTDDELNTIIGTIDFFGENYQLDIFDLKTARYRVFDWLAMKVQGRRTGDVATKVLVHSFLKVNGDVDAFIQDLRETDYDIDSSWESIVLGE